MTQAAASAGLADGRAPAAATAAARPSRMSWGLAAVAVLAASLSLLSIGIGRDWRLAHEDDGAVYTSIARSHVVMGLEKTRFHDFLTRRDTGEMLIYGHHPPLGCLTLAAAFKLTGSDRPWVVRGVAILFHLASLALFMFWVREGLGETSALWAGLIWAFLPMSAVFGRVFTQIVLGLLPVTVQLMAYDRFKRRGTAGWAALCCAGVVLGGLIDWTPFFFSVVLWTAELHDVVKRRARPGLLAALTAAGLAVFVFDLLHLYYAGHGSLQPFLKAFSKNAHASGFKFGPLAFAGTVVDFYRRYFTHAGLAASLALAWALLRGGRGAEALDPVLRRTAGLAGLGACLHVLAAPSYAKVHHYYYFYFLPFAALSLYAGGARLLSWAGERPSLARRAVVAIALAEFLGMSAYMIHLRHTRAEAYALRITAETRRDFLLPSYLEAAAKGAV